MADYTTIDNPELHFQVKTYTGNGTAIGSGGQAITLDGDEDMQPDLVWIKDRTDSDRPRLFDAVRGVTKELDTSDNTAETTLTEGLPAFGSDGFTVGTHEGVNSNTDSFVAWCWKESATAGMDIVSYTGNATNRTISHSLSAVPHLMLIKNRDSARNWVVYHHKNTSTPQNDRLLLNTNDATDSSDAEFNDTAPTSSVFTVGTGNSPNESGDKIISYLFSEKQGYSMFGKFEGNNSTDGAFVYLGFRPAWVMIKSSATGGSNYDWVIFDNKRNTGNVNDDFLDANLANAEVTSGRNEVDFLSNGFKCRSSYGDVNSNTTYIYLAFAEAPFVNSNGVPCNAR